MTPKASGSCRVPLPPEACVGSNRLHRACAPNRIEPAAPHESDQIGCAVPRSGAWRGAQRGLARRSGTQLGQRGGEQDKSVPPALATPETCITPAQLRFRGHGTHTEHDFSVWGG